MNRLILSIHIDIEGNYPICQELIDRQEQYALDCFSDYRLIKHGLDYDLFYDDLQKLDPDITHFQAINNYKIQLLYLHSFLHEEILYLDSDVYVNTDKNIFDEFDFSKGLLLAPQEIQHKEFLNLRDRVRWGPEYEKFKEDFFEGYDWTKEGKSIDEVLADLKIKYESLCDVEPDDEVFYSPDPRSPLVKYAIAKSLLFLDGVTEEINIWNTGIIGAHKETLKQLDYFGEEFKSICNYIIDCKSEVDGLFDSEIQKNFNLNNEAILSYFTKAFDIPVQKLSDEWHHMYNENILNKEAKFIHLINKRFEDVL